MTGEDGNRSHLLQGYNDKNVEEAIVFVYTHGNDSLDTICSEWSIARVYAVALMMQDQMSPGEAQSPTAPAPGFQSGEKVEMRGDRKIKTTKISFADMVKKAKAGYDTSIRGI